MHLQEEIIRRLADGALHSGSVLAQSLGVSRGAVWKHVRTLPALGLVVSAVTGRGYQLNGALELLRREEILGVLDGDVRSALEALEVLSVTDSTSTRLAAEQSPAPGRMRACFAEYQTGGRGRRGRRWVSPYGGGLCLSVSWCLANVPRDLPALSPAVAVMVLRALTDAGAAGVQLKWPNDLVFGDGKLGGILVDVVGESVGPLKVVIGIGLNLRVPGSVSQAIAAGGGLPAAGLDRAVKGRQLSRNHLAGLLLNAICHGMWRFAREGFAAFIDEWRQQDYLCGKPVTIDANGRLHPGIVRGIGADGSLLLETDRGTMPLLGGEVSVRPAT